MLKRDLVKGSVGLALFFMASACASARQRQDPLDPLPPWPYTELVQAAVEKIPLGEPAVRDQVQIEDIRLLAWHIKEDDRPLRVEQVFFWVRLNQLVEGRRWVLLNLFRHPQHDNEWHYVGATHSRHYATQFYDHPPTNKEIYDFLSFMYAWQFESESHRGGFRILAGDVRARTWRAATGEAPTKFYRP